MHPHRYTTTSSPKLPTPPPAPPRHCRCSRRRCCSCCCCWCLLRMILNEKSAVCSGDLARPVRVCVLLLPDGRCCCDNTAASHNSLLSPASAPAAAAAVAVCCCSWCCSHSLPRMFLECAVLVVLSYVVHGFLFLTKYHVSHIESSIGFFTCPACVEICAVFVFFFRLFLCFIVWFLVAAVLLVFFIAVGVSCVRF